MLKRRLSLLALLAAFTLVVAACGDDDATTTTAGAPAGTTATTAAPGTTAGPATTAAPEPTMAPGPVPLACMVSDQAGIDDDSFNETAWNGMLLSEAELGVQIEFLESTDATDYRPNIDAFIAQGCDLIVTVGFLLADDTGAAAVANPDARFAIIDFPVFPDAPWLDADGNMVANVRGLTYQTDEATFLAGYLAAGMTETGVIGTFGGINIPPVTIFMDGFRNGAAYYDSVKGTSTEVKGWDGADGLFTDNFTSLEDGRAFGQNLLDEGADIILPVAGPVGLGTGAAIDEFNAAGGDAKLIWVDADGFETTEFGDIIITSVLKNMDISVFNTINNIVVLGTVGNQYLGTLANNGVGITSYHAFEDRVPDELKAEIEQLRLDIIAEIVSVAG
ncbi:MAG: BMP family ABC transporter substrate-binding protein [Acidimicrobiia bacterium]